MRGRAGMLLDPPGAPRMQRRRRRHMSTSPSGDTPSISETPTEPSGRLTPSPMVGFGVRWSRRSTAASVPTPTLDRRITRPSRSCVAPCGTRCSPLYTTPRNSIDTPTSKGSKAKRQSRGIDARTPTRAATRFRSLKRSVIPSSRSRYLRRATALRLNQSRPGSRRTALRCRSSPSRAASARLKPPRPQRTGMWIHMDAGVSTNDLIPPC